MTTKKQVLNTVQSILNDREEWELENGCYMYNLKKQKDKIVLQVFEEYNNGVFDSLYAEFFTDISNDPVVIIKGLITDIYENCLNNKQQFARQTPSFYKRKIRSLTNWTIKNNEKKVKEITQQLTERFTDDKRISSDIVNLKDIVRELYNCLSRIDSEWKQKEIKDRLLKRCSELGINNVECSHVANNILAYRLDTDVKAEYLIEFDYCNINSCVNELIKQLCRKVA